MKLNELDLNLFKIFRAIYKLRSISQAAKELGVSQPTVSKTLNKLRCLFDDQLFVYSSKQMQATKFSQKIFGAVSGGIELLESAVQDNLQFNPKEGEHTFRVGMSDYSEVILLPRILRTFKALNPRLKIEIEHLPMPLRSRALEDLTTDLNIHGSIAGIYQQNYGTGIVQKFLFEDQYLFMIGSRFTDLRGKITLEELGKLPHARFGVSRIIDKLLADHGLTRHVVLQVPHILVLPRIVADNELVITIPERLAKDFVKRLPLIILKSPVKLPPLKFHMYWHEKNQKSSSHIWFRNVLEQVSQTI